MHLHVLRSVLFFSATFDFNLAAAQIPGHYNASRHDQSATNRETRLDVKQLDPLVSFYFRASLAPSTTRSYDNMIMNCLKENTCNFVQRAMNLLFR